MSTIPRSPGEDGNSAAVAWAVSARPVAYEAAVAAMEERVGQIADGTAAELVWLLEHPPLYTAGTRARPEDLIDAGGLPVIRTGRGGELTYHGPGQRVVYVMLDVRRRFGGDVRAFTTRLEDWVIAALADLGVAGRRVEGRTGVWVGESARGEDKLAKIAALGLRIRRGVSFHGVSINVAPDLDRYRGIVPCGIRDAGVTSLAALSKRASLKDVDNVLATYFRPLFAPLVAAPAFPSVAASLPRESLGTTSAS